MMSPAPKSPDEPHELRWRDTMAELIRFRHWLKGRYKVYLEDEIHAADMISKPSKVAASFQRLKKHERLAIIRNFADQIGGAKRGLVSKTGRLRLPQPGASPHTDRPTQQSYDVCLGQPFAFDQRTDPDADGSGSLTRAVTQCAFDAARQVFTSGIARWHG